MELEESTSINIQELVAEIIDRMEYNLNYADNKTTDIEFELPTTNSKEIKKIFTLLNDMCSDKYIDYEVEDEQTYSGATYYYASLSRKYPDDYYFDYEDPETEDAQPGQRIGRYKNMENESMNLKEELSLSELVKDSINHLVNDLGRDSSAEDFADDVINDIENNYDVDVDFSHPLKYKNWASEVACEVSRQLNNNVSKNVSNNDYELEEAVADKTYQITVKYHNEPARIEARLAKDRKDLEYQLNMDDEVEWYDFDEKQFNESLDQMREKALKMKDNSNAFAILYGYKVKDKEVELEPEEFSTYEDYKDRIKQIKDSFTKLSDKDPRGNRYGHEHNIEFYTIYPNKKQNVNENILTESGWAENHYMLSPAR